MQDIENLDIGDKVKHPKFGTGTVVFRTGEGDKQKATVKFGSDVGEKKLLVSLAKLKIISERPTLAAEASVEAVPGRTRLGKGDGDTNDDDDKKILAIDGEEDEDLEDIEIADDDVADDDEVAMEDEEDKKVRKAPKAPKAAKGKKSKKGGADEEEAEVDGEDLEDEDDEEIEEDEE